MKKARKARESSSKRFMNFVWGRGEGLERDGVIVGVFIKKSKLKNPRM